MRKKYGVPLTVNPDIVHVLGLSCRVPVCSCVSQWSTDRRNGRIGPLINYKSDSLISRKPPKNGYDVRAKDRTPNSTDSNKRARKCQLWIAEAVPTRSLWCSNRLLALFRLTRRASKWIQNCLLCSKKTKTKLHRLEQLWRFSSCSRIRSRLRTARNPHQSRKR